MANIRDLGRGIARFVEGQRKRRQLERELDQVAAMGSLDAVLADAGLVRSQIEPLIAGASGTGELLDQMAGKLGVDPAKLPVEELRDMTWNCTTCKDKRECRQWLAGERQADYHDFCPNADELDRVAHAQHPEGAPSGNVPPESGHYRPNGDERRHMRAEASDRKVRALLDSGY